MHCYWPKGGDKGALLLAKGWGMKVHCYWPKGGDKGALLLAKGWG